MSEKSAPPGSQPRLWTSSAPAPAPAEETVDATEITLPGELRRWRAQAIVAPIEQLVRSLAHTQIDEDRLDVRRLCQHAIDVVVSSQGFAHQTTEADLIEALDVLAREMTPDADAAETRDVAERVYRGLLNEQHDCVKSSFTAIGKDAVRRPFSFRLLFLRGTR